MDCLKTGFVGDLKKMYMMCDSKRSRDVERWGFIWKFWVLGAGLRRQKRYIHDLYKEGGRIFPSPRVYSQGQISESTDDTRR